MWYEKIFNNKNGVGMRELAKFLNSNQIEPGRVLVLPAKYLNGCPYIIEILYYAEKELS